LEDAREWVFRRQNTGELYDIVIHDCFSGGGVPQQLYTTQFWDALKKSVDPDGVVAVVRVNPPLFPVSSN
jgi:spermidine synthase